MGSGRQDVYQLGVRARIMAAPEADRLELALNALEEVFGTAGDIDALMGAFRLTVSEATLVAALNRRAPHVVSKEALYRALYPAHDEADMKIVDIFICKARAKGVRIETHWGRGWSLPERLDVAALPVVARRSNRPWTEAEDERLLQAAAGDGSWQEIGQRFACSADAAKGRLARLQRRAVRHG